MRREVFYEYDEYIGGSCHEMLFFFDTFGLVTHYIPSHPGTFHLFIEILVASRTLKSAVTSWYDSSILKKD